MCVGNGVCGLEFNLYSGHIKMFEKKVMFL